MSKDSELQGQQGPQRISKSEADQIKSWVNGAKTINDFLKLMSGADRTNEHLPPEVQQILIAQIKYLRLTLEKGEELLDLIVVKSVKQGQDLTESKQKLLAQLNESMTSVWQALEGLKDIIQP